MATEHQFVTIYPNSLNCDVCGREEDHLIHDLPVPAPPTRTQEPEKLKKKAETCDWTDGDYAWSSGCGREFSFNDDGPKENGFNHCPYCGRVLKVKKQRGTERP